MTPNPATYLVLGDDGTQYGPIDENELRTWIKEGRVKFQTQAWLEGSPEWKPLSEFPAFRGLFAPPPPPQAKPKVQTQGNNTAPSEGKPLGIAAIIFCYIISAVIPIFALGTAYRLIRERQIGHGIGCIAVGLFAAWLYVGAK